MADMIPAVGAIIPSTTSRQEVVTKVYEGDRPGSTQVHSTVYNITIYDVNGKLQTVTNSHVINYTV
jgi:hypothetical protein